MSEWEEFSNFVTDRKKPGEDIQKTINPFKCDLLHMAVGISTEAGELLDAVKKHVFYNKNLDLINVIEELGDLEFYLEGIRQTLLLARKPILAENMRKLTLRYSKGYSDQAASDRVDKEQEK